MDTKALIAQIYLEIALLQETHGLLAYSSSTTPKKRQRHHSRKKRALILEVRKAIADAQLKCWVAQM